MHYDTLVSFLNFAINYFKLEKYELAIKYALKSLSILTQIVDENHSEVANVHRILAEIYIKTRNHA